MKAHPKRRIRPSASVGHASSWSNEEAICQTQNRYSSCLSVAALCVVGEIAAFGVTDFEEFAIYDCRVKPDKIDKASVGRVALYGYRDYGEKWDEIAAIFSKDAILRGSFDKYAEGVKGKKGTAEVDDAFLEEIERWRDMLARNIAIRNEKLSVRELNFAVQATIDRIVFLRICEDRGVERDEQLKTIAEEGDIYSGLCRLFQQADARYNSGLFHFAMKKMNPAWRIRRLWA